MKNDITYEYRVFTNRLIDVESMEVGICTSKVINELKPKNKVDGRFFHTSDTDEWFFCWNGELQKLNLKGDSDVSAALAEVEKLISDAKVAVEDAKKTAGEAKDAADAAKNAADSATAAVETIENKADKSEVESLSKMVEEKADKSTVESLSEKVDAIPSVDKIALKEDIPNVPTKVSELENDSNYLTEHQDITGKQDVIEDLDVIRLGAAAGATALGEAKAYVDGLVKDVEGNSKFDVAGAAAAALDEAKNYVDGKGYVTEEFVGEEIKKLNVPTKVSELENDSNYLTSDAADLKYAPIGSEGVDLGSYATKVYVGEEIAKINVPTKVSQLENDSNYLTEHQDISGKQDVIDDIDVIREGANKGATALQSVPEEYITETELNNKGYLTEHQDITGKQDVISDLDAIRSGAAAGATALQAIPAEYITETELTGYGYLTEETLANSTVISGIQSQIDKINNLLGKAEEWTDTILNA